MDLMGWVFCCLVDFGQREDNVIELIYIHLWYEINNNGKMPELLDDIAE